MLARRTGVSSANPARDDVEKATLRERSKSVGSLYLVTYVAGCRYVPNGNRSSRVSALKKRAKKELFSSLFAHNIHGHESLRTRPSCLVSFHPNHNAFALYAQTRAVVTFLITINSTRKPQHINTYSGDWLVGAHDAPERRLQ